MSLLGTVTEENYYNGSQTFIGDGNAFSFTLTFETLPTNNQVRAFLNNAETFEFTISGATIIISHDLRKL